MGFNGISMALIYGSACPVTAGMPAETLAFIVREAQHG